MKADAVNSDQAEIRAHNSLLSGTVVTSLGTLCSRVLGLARDVITASLFGLAAGGVMDAIVVAFRVPNLFRALFGEGALTASYLPVFARLLKDDRRGASQLFTATMRWLAMVLAGMVIVGEIGIGLWAWVARDDRSVVLLAGLTAAMLPYLILVCLAAITSASLQALADFAVPAFAPAVLNICWIVGAALIAPRVTSDAAAQAYIIAGCIIVGGFLQWMVQWPAIRREGYRYDPGWRACAASCGRLCGPLSLRRSA